MSLFFQKFWMFAMQTPKNCEKWAYFLRKIPPKMGALFCTKGPLKMGTSFQIPAAHPVQTKSEYPQTIALHGGHKETWFPILTSLLLP